MDSAPAKDRAVIKRLLAHLDRDRPDTPALELLTAAAASLLADPPVWANGSPSIGLLSTTLNDCVPSRAADAAGGPADPNASPRRNLGAEFFDELRNSFGGDVDAEGDGHREIVRRVLAEKITVARFRELKREASGSGAAFRRLLAAEPDQERIFGRDKA